MSELNSNQSSVSQELDPLPDSPVDSPMLDSKMKLDALNDKKTSCSKGLGSTRTSYNYVNMIVECILESPNKKVLLSDIYKHIQKNYHEMIDKGVDWQNGIRHNLSLNDCFLKQGRNPNGKGYFWEIAQKNLAYFEKGDFRRRWSQCRTRRQRSKSTLKKANSMAQPMPSPMPMIMPIPSFTPPTPNSYNYDYHYRNMMPNYPEGMPYPPNQANYCVPVEYQSPSAMNSSYYSSPGMNSPYFPSNQYQQNVPLEVPKYEQEKYFRKEPSNNFPNFNNPPHSSNSRGYKIDPSTISPICGYQDFNSSYSARKEFVPKRRNEYPYFSIDHILNGFH